MSYTYDLNAVLDEPIRRQARPLTAADREKLCAAGLLVPPDPKTLVKAVDFVKKARLAQKLAWRETAVRVLVKAGMKP